MPVGVGELRLLPQDQVAGAGHDAGLLEQLTVRGCVEVLPRLDVAAHHAPLVGRPRGVLVAMLEQEVPTAIDEEDDCEAGRWLGHERPP